MKKIILTFAICLMAAFSYGSDGDTITRTFKRVIKNGDTSLKVTYTITTIDTIPRNNYSSEIDRFQQALKSGNESIAIQKKLNEYYTAEIKRLKVEKAKTD